jgi:hypothetical protein
MSAGMRRNFRARIRAFNAPGKQARDDLARPPALSHIFLAETGLKRQ